MKKKSLFRIKTPLQCVIAGIVAGFTALIITLMIACSVLVNYDISFSSFKYIWIVIGIIAGFIAGGVSGRFSKSRAIIWGTLSSFSLMLLLLIFLIVFNGFDISLFIISLVPSFVISGAAGGIIFSNLR